MSEIKVPLAQFYVSSLFTKGSLRCSWTDEMPAGGRYRFRTGNSVLLVHEQRQSEADFGNPLTRRDLLQQVQNVRAVTHRVASFPGQSGQQRDVHRAVF